MAALLAGVGPGVAQTFEGQQKTFSGGTQGLQERLYEERMKELQQNQSGSQQSQGKEDAAGKRLGSGATGSQSQRSADGRQGASGHNPSSPER